MDHDEGIRAEGDHGFKDFTRVSQRFVEGTLADRNHLDGCFLCRSTSSGIQRTLEGACQSHR